MACSDIHPNNVLVDDYSVDWGADWGDVTETCYNYLISDIGEGKVLRDGQEFQDASSAGHSYSAASFRPPTLLDQATYTAADDVFSFGILVCRIMECRRLVCIAQPSESVLAKLQPTHDGSAGYQNAKAQVVPVSFKALVSKCISVVEEKPTMEEICLFLGEVKTNSSDFGRQGLFRTGGWAIWDFQTALLSAQTPSTTSQDQDGTEN